MSEFKITPIDSVIDVLDMRVIRNDVRNYMTHDKKHLSIEKQLAWYNHSYKHNNRIGELFGFIGRVEQEPIAYGLVSKRQGNYWVSGGVHEVYRGQGYGEAMFRHLGGFILGTLEEPAYLDVLNTNEPAIELYKKLGYQAINQTDHLTVMRLDNVGD